MSSLAVSSPVEAPSGALTPLWLHQPGGLWLLRRGWHAPSPTAAAAVVTDHATRLRSVLLLLRLLLLLLLGGNSSELGEKFRLNMRRVSK